MLPKNADQICQQAVSTGANCLLDHIGPVQEKAFAASQEHKQRKCHPPVLQFTFSGVLLC